MAQYEKASQEVLDIAQEYIENHHPDLLDARILFLFRDEAAKKAGRTVLGTARKTPAWLAPLGDWDYMIEVAHDEWQRMERARREALIDHELCHCEYMDGKAKMRGHDIEEFVEIIERHGLWTFNLIQAQRAMEKAEQMELPINSDEKPKGSVQTIDPNSESIKKIQAGLQKIKDMGGEVIVGDPEAA